MAAAVAAVAAAGKTRWRVAAYTTASAGCSPFAAVASKGMNRPAEKFGLGFAFEVVDNSE